MPIRSKISCICLFWDERTQGVQLSRPATPINAISPAVAGNDQSTVSS